MTLGCSLTVSAQSSFDGTTESPAVEERPAAPARIESLKPPDKRLFGIIPNYRTTNASAPFTPLTPKQKLDIASHDSFDWPTYTLAATITFATRGKQETKTYGTGWSGFGNRYVRNSADQIIGNMLTEGLLPSLLHEDPRYFRQGTGTFWSRLSNAVTQVAIIRKDSGKRTFNTSEFLGNAVTAGISSTYSPNLRSWGSSTGKLGLMIGTEMFSNALKEFGPDVKRYLFHRN
jgi:hypothetical protein